MNVILEIPEDLSRPLSEGFDDIGRAALEALAAEAYEKDFLSLEQIRRLLDLPSYWEAQDVLKRHGVWPGQSVCEVLSDMKTLDHFQARIL